MAGGTVLTAIPICCYLGSTSFNSKYSS